MPLQAAIVRDVVQSINPFTAFMTGGQFGLININLANRASRRRGRRALRRRTYGKQLWPHWRRPDRAAHFNPPGRSAPTRVRRSPRSTMLGKVADVKKKQARAALRLKAAAAERSVVAAALENDAHRRRVGNEKAAPE